MSEFLSLIVKGDKFQAAAAAAARKVPFAFVRETRHGETIGRVGLQHKATVRAWFNEPDSAPRPAGTLLLWSEY